MPVSPELLAGELKVLCRGRGVHTPRIDRQVGPAVREACDIGRDDGAEAVREKIETWVHNRARHLPEDLRLAVVVSLALRAEAQYAFLARRIEWLAHREGRDARTIRRRIGDGLTRLVEAAAREEDPARGGWRIERLQVVLRLDGAVPRRIERCSIVAERDGARDVPWNVEPGVDASVLRGGTWAPDRCLRLPRPLRRGEVHEFALEVPMPGFSPDGPYQFRPPHPCDHLELLVALPSGRQAPDTRHGNRRSQVASIVGTSAVGATAAVGAGAGEPLSAGFPPEHRGKAGLVAASPVAHRVPDPRSAPPCADHHPPSVAWRRPG